MSCLIVIPGTWVICGEGGNFCSDECLEKFEQEQKVLAQTPQEDIMKDKRHSRSNKQ